MYSPNFEKKLWGRVTGGLILGFFHFLPPRNLPPLNFNTKSESTFLQQLFYFYRLSYSVLSRKLNSGVKKTFLGFFEKNLTPKKFDFGG